MRSVEWDGWCGIDCGAAQCGDLRDLRAYNFHSTSSSVQSNRVYNGGRALGSPLASKIATLLINCACRISCNCVRKGNLCVCCAAQYEGSCAGLMCM